MAEWSRYELKLPGTSRHSPFTCKPLAEIYHVAHVAEALRIIDDTRLKARPVYDESRLNKTRIHVTWMSPNYWQNGWIYGTVRFEFDWKSLIDGKQIYWVEAITKYSPTACRFLITDRNVSCSLLKAYDPNTDDGPLREVGDDWFWNGDVCLEIMIESDILLADCRKVDFVNHHPDICRLDKDACKERNQASHISARKLLSYLMGSATHTLDHALNPLEGQPGGRRTTHVTQVGLESTIHALSTGTQFSGLIRKGPDARAIIRAAMLQLARGRRNQARRLAGLLSSDQVLEDTVNSIAQRHFKLPYLKSY
jgi:hypothetical protein